LKTAWLDRATIIDDSLSHYSAISLDLLIRMKAGRFKVFKHLTDWWDEFLLYHRRIAWRSLGRRILSRPCHRFSARGSQHHNAGRHSRALVCDLSEPLCLTAAN
jgi:hypothetical protein